MPGPIVDIEGHVIDIVRAWVGVVDVPREGLKPLRAPDKGEVRPLNRSHSSDDILPIGRKIARICVVPHTPRIRRAIELPSRSQDGIPESVRNQVPGYSHKVRVFRSGCTLCQCVFGVAGSV